MEVTNVETTESQPVTLPTTVLTDLHHYALFSICKAIESFSDQLAFAQSSRKICDIFVSRIWRFQPERLVVGPLALAVSAKTRNQHFFFVKHMQEHFTTFTSIEDISYPGGLRAYVSALRQEGITKFPNVKVCDLNDFGTIRNIVMLQLTKLMPNLQTLKLASQSVSGTHISKFVHLEELYLKNVYIQPHVMSHIFKTLQRLHTLDINTGRKFILKKISSKSLQVLRLKAVTAEKIMPEIMALPNLRELEVRYTERCFYEEPKYHNGWPELATAGGVHNIFPHVIAAKAADITSIYINNHSVHLPEYWTSGLPLFKLPKLKRLACHRWLYDSLFLARHLDQSKLTFLSLGNWMIDEPDVLTTAVGRFQQLQELEIIDDSSERYRGLEFMASVLHLFNMEHPLLVWDLHYSYHLLRNTGLGYWMHDRRLKPAHFERRYHERELLGFNVKFDKSPNA